MQIRNPLAGNGSRRKTDEQWDKLQRQLSAAQRDLANANQQIATLTRQRDEARSNDIRHHNLWQSAHREVMRLRFLLGADAELPATQVPAPVDNGCRDTPLAAAQTARDTSLDALAQPGEEELLARLKANAVTAVLPRIPDRAPEPNPLDIPAPHPMASATAVPANIPDLAHDKVHAALDEAS